MSHTPHSSRLRFPCFQQYNAGVLPCARFEPEGRLYVLLGTEYRSASRLRPHQRAAASHRRDKKVLQTVVLGGRHKSGESVDSTAVREFWEESARLIDRCALQTCLAHRAASFDFRSSKYRLLIALDCVHPDITHAFAQRVTQEGYPDECMLQLFWIPWQTVRECALSHGLLNLSSSIEPKQSTTPLSGFATDLLTDHRVLRHLNALDNFHAVPPPQRIVFAPIPCAARRSPAAPMRGTTVSFGR